MPGIGKYKRKPKGKRGFKMNSPFRNENQVEKDQKTIMAKWNEVKERLKAANAPADVIAKQKEQFFKGK
jgi:hypothetical protein